MLLRKRQQCTEIVKKRPQYTKLCAAAFSHLTGWGRSVIILVYINEDLSLLLFCKSVAKDSSEIMSCVRRAVAFRMVTSNCHGAISNTSKDVVVRNSLPTNDAKGYLSRLPDFTFCLQSHLRVKSVTFAVYSLTSLAASVLFKIVLPLSMWLAGSATHGSFIGCLTRGNFTCWRSFL